MKKFFVIVLASSLMFSCQESKESAHKLPSQYDRKVGEQISLDVANRWAASFATKAKGARTENAGSLDAAMLAQVLGEGTDKIGVVFHHGIDQIGDYHAMMCAIDATGVLFKSAVVDLSTGVVISEAEAKTWSKRYSEQHPATPWYHFFGMDVFHEIQSNQAFNYIDIVRGLNDSDEEQVLLFVYNNRDVSGGRTEGEDVTVYDASYPCPPCSSSN